MENNTKTHRIPGLGWIVSGVVAMTALLALVAMMFLRDSGPSILN